MEKFRQFKTRLFPKGMKRELANYRNRIFHRTTPEKLTAGIERLNIPPGSVVCIHAMLSGLGYIAGGPGTIIKSVMQAVPDVTIIMPTFPFDGTTKAYLSTKPVYNKDITPSKSGLLSEILRTFPNAQRSYHPTHPCAALGPKADFLIQGSESAKTPFGDDSSYGRYCSLDNAVQLLIHTNSSSIVHRVQELVGIPNLFYENTFTAQGLDKTGRTRDYEIYIHTPQLPLYWVLPGDTPDTIEYIWSPDYAFLFPDYNRNRILGKLQSQTARNVLLERNRYFNQTGIYTATRINDALVTAVRVKPWLERICTDLTDSMQTFSRHYSKQNMTAAAKKGLLTKY